MTDATLADKGWLPQFPVAFFAVVMGLSGLTLALRAAEQALGLADGMSTAAAVTTVGTFGAIAACYAAKVVLHRAAVTAEWASPVRITFFPAISISMLLIATILAPVLPGLALPVWVAGAAAQATLALAVVANWIGHRPFQPIHLNPAWFIPAVGNVVAPLGGVSLGFAELSWLFFSAGMLFWVVLQTLVFNRLIFHDPLPERLAPTLTILIAPPALAFIAYYRLTGEVDAFARILLYSGYVALGVVLTQVSRLARLPFALSWWALSFPIAALAVASLLYGEVMASSAHRLIGLTLAAALAVIVVGLAARTAAAIRADEIFRPD